MLGYVLGNETADLDSVVSSLGLAWLLNDLGYKNARWKPVINRSKIGPNTSLMVSNTWISQIVGWSDWMEQFEFIDTIDTSSNMVCLVDHNQDQLFQSPLIIVDHHIGNHTKIDEVKKTEVFPTRLVAGPSVGSCSSLVALLIKAWRVKRDVRVLKCLLGAVLNDTHFLDPALRNVRYNDVDIDAKNFLMSEIAEWSETNFSDFRLALKAVKNDWKSVWRQGGLETLMLSDHKRLMWGDGIVMRTSSVAVFPKELHEQVAFAADMESLLMRDTVIEPENRFASEWLLISSRGGKRTYTLYFLESPTTAQDVSEAKFNMSKASILVSSFMQTLTTKTEIGKPSESLSFVTWHVKPDLSRKMFEKLFDEWQSQLYLSV